MTKILIFSMVALLTLSIVVTTQQVNALEVRTDFYNRHTTASHGDSKVCGDHLCAAGEKPMWTHATWGHQKLDSGKVPTGYHGEDVMSQLATVSNQPSHETNSTK